jgi:peptidoglycan glycosyltransferase
MNVSKNIRNLTNFFVMLFLILSGGLVYWQVGVAQAVTSNVHNSRFCFSDNVPIRGRIYDRNGVLLAESKPDPKGVCGYVREYSNPSLAGVIGYYVPGYSVTGIEKEYDDILSGRTGSTELTNTVNSLLHRPPIGGDIYLTIDDRIQRIANQRFDDLPEASTQRPLRGAVVVSDPKTGEVLALVSRPNYDPNKMVQTLQKGDLSYYNQLEQDSNNQPLLSRTLQGLYIPGSTFKTVTLIAGLDTGKTSLNQQFNQQQALGPVHFNGQPIGPSGNNLPASARFPVTTEYGFTYSDNVIFAQIGVNTGFKDWIDYTKRFYIGQEIPFDLPVAVSTVLPQGKDTLADNELAANAFGQGTDFVTPFQMSLVDNAVANDGQLMQPRLLLKITDRQGNLLKTYNSSVLANTMSQQTARDTRQAMYDVVHCGWPVTDMPTSRFSIIGKTGTAELGGGRSPHDWMITAAPYNMNNPDQLPALTIVTIRENGVVGAHAAGTLSAHIYNEVFEKEYVKVQTSEPDLNHCSRAGLGY